MEKKKRQGSHSFNRRELLRGAGAVGIVGVTGCTALLSQAVPPSRPPLYGSAYAQPTEIGWQPKQPPLTTPWTEDVLPESSLPEYPRPQMKRKEWLNLNGVWQFAAASQGESPPVGRDLPDRILVPFPPESALSGIMRHHERMFYRRRFIVPPHWRVAGQGEAEAHQRLLLHFDAVDYQTDVWINGGFLGTHEGGYDRFTFDITDALRIDEAHKSEGVQEIIVGVFDPTENGDQPLGKQRVSALDNSDSVLFYTPTSGIWQTVWMEPVAPAHIERLVMTPDIPGQSLRLQVHAAYAQHKVVEATAYDGHHVLGHAAGKPGQEITLRIPSPKLWSPDSPFLYGLTVRLVEPKAALESTSSRDREARSQAEDLEPFLDEVESYFGMRSIGLSMIDGRSHIILNGELTFQLSTLQQGFWPDGIYTAATDEGLKFDLAQAKRLGFNTVRKHQKLEPDRWYYHADTLGLLVWQDMPATATGRQAPHTIGPAPAPPLAGRQEFERELRRIVEQYCSHPSIVMWIPFNEGWSEYDTARIADMVKRWDPSRLVDVMSGLNVCECGTVGGDVIDRHNLRTVSAGPPPQPTESRAAIIGEFGAYGISVEGHTWDPRHSHPRIQMADMKALTDQYVEALAQVQSFVTASGLSGANYNLFADVEHQVNGLFTYDRKILKPNAAQVQKANARVLAAASRLK